MRTLFSETEYIERRDLTILHKIVLRIAWKDLKQELIASIADIDSLDLIGRTPVRKKFTSIFIAFGSILRPNAHFAHFAHYNV